MKNIANTLKERLQWINFRANCFFPGYINEDNDQIISFQNYWQWKRKVNVIAHLVLRSEDSTIVSQKEFNIAGAAKVAEPGRSPFPKIIILSDPFKFFINLNAVDKDIIPLPIKM